MKYAVLVAILIPSVCSASSGEWLVSATPEWAMEKTSQGLDHGFGTSITTQYTVSSHVFASMGLRFLDYGNRQEEQKNGGTLHGEALRRLDVVPSVGFVFGQQWKWRMSVGAGLRSEHARNRWNLFMDAIAPINEDNTWRVRGVAECQTSLTYRIPRDVGGSLEVGLQGAIRHSLGDWRWSPEMGLALMIGWWWLG